MEMAKKASKKEAVAAKKAKTTKKAPVAKKAKATKAAPKSAAKPAKKVATKAKAPVAKAKGVKTAPAAKKAKAAPPPKVVKEKPSKLEKVSKPSKIEEKASPKLKLVPESAPVAEVEVPKKEKKIKIDKTGLTEEQIKWHELHEKLKGVKALPYSISGQYEAKTPISHKIFGWGFILSNEYDRLEVLFEDAKRMLISNRKL